MIEFSSNYLSINDFKIFYYGILISIGAILAIVLAAKEARRKGLDENFLYDAVPWVLFAGIVGARLWHIFTPPPSMVAQGITTRFYLTHPLDAVNIRAGGLGIPGAVIGGLLAFFIVARERGEHFATWLDVLAPAVPLGQAIGRWGNFFNQELYGAPTNLPWGIFIEPAYRLPEFAAESHFHPIFLYESIWNLASVFALLWLARRKSDRLKAGDLFLIYLISYPLVRFLLDFLRLDASEVGGVNANQTVMLAVMVISGTALFLRHRSGNRKTLNEEELTAES
ncbi:MAG: prolipoprotein diacylglyceryl transferase [Anaerolineales bacterium]|nr:prolipoprotein diacylglyceryl transferase [Anaerolineales bacterium]